MEFWIALWEKISFPLICLIVVAGLYLLAKLAEHFMPRRQDVSKTRRICITAICAAVAAVLQVLDFPLLFLAPEFYKLDFSEVPVLLCGFYLGPAAAVVCEALKIVLKLIFKSTSTAFVGDFANFVVGCSMVLPAVILYDTRKTRRTAVVGLATGTGTMTVFGSLFNAFYLLPTFAELFHWPLDEIIAAGSAINPAISDISTFVLLSVAPLNLIKGISVSVLTLLLYKRIARPLFGLKQ